MPKKFKKGEVANHLVNFQYATLGTPGGRAGVLGGSPGTPPSSLHRSHHQQQYHHNSVRRQSMDPTKLKEALRIQSLQCLLYPDLVQCAVLADGTSSGSSTTLGGSASTPSTATPPERSPQRESPATGAMVGRALGRALSSFDTLVPWDFICGAVVRGDAASDFCCPICLDSLCAARVTPCGHWFCLPCILHCLTAAKRSGQQQACPMCHAVVVPRMLKRCVTLHVTPIVEGRERTFVLVLRHREMPAVIASEDVHLVDAMRHARPSVVLPRLEDDISWLYSRYVIATEEWHELQQAIELSALEARRGLILSENPQRPFPHEVATELDVVADCEAMVRRMELRGAAATTAAPSSATTPVTAGPQGGSGASRGVSPVQGDTGILPPPLSSPSSPLSTSTTALRPPAAATADGAAATGMPGAASPPPPALYELYMDSEGNQAFLHFVCVKMLRDDCIAKGIPLPSKITVKVLDVEEVLQTEQTRNALRPLAHVPLCGSVRTCFADMSELVSPHVMRAFREVVDRRLQRIRDKALADAEQSTAVMTVDDAWEKHKASRREADPLWNNQRNDISPTMQAFAVPLEELPSLDLPPAAASSKATVTSASSNDRTSFSVTHSAGCGPSDSSLETRQRATKGHCGAAAVDGGIARPLTASNLSAVADAAGACSTPGRPYEILLPDLVELEAAKLRHVAAPSHNTVRSCWGAPPGSDAAHHDAAATKLFSASLASQPPAAVPTWGGRASLDFAPSGQPRCMYAPAPTPYKGPALPVPPRVLASRLVDDEEDVGEHIDDDDDPFDCLTRELCQPRSGTGANVGMSRGAGTSATNGGGGRKHKRKSGDKKKGTTTTTTFSLAGTTTARTSTK